MVTLTLDQGNYLLRHSHNAGFPEKIGDRSFTHSQRATFSKEMRQLYKALKKESPILRDDRQLYFGPRESYDEILHKQAPGEDMVEEERVRFRIKKGEGLREVEIEVNGQAKNGIFRILYLSTHPDSKLCMAPGAQEETVWPIAEKFKCTIALEQAIGLDKKDTWDVSWDDETDKSKVIKKETPVLPEPAGVTMKE